MNSLLLKDFFLLKKHLWFALFYSFIMFFIFGFQVSNVQGMIYSIGATMISYTMLMYTTAYDDKNNSEVLINSLPLSRNKIVLSRYVSIFIFIVIGISSMVVAGYVLKTIEIIKVSWILRSEDILGAILGSSFISFLYLPAYYKFGYVKAKFFNLLLFAVAFGLPMIIGTYLKGIEKPPWVDQLIANLISQSDFIIGLYIIIFTIILGLISYQLSITVYKKREF